MQESETNDRDLNKFEMRFYEKQYPEENELVMVRNMAWIAWKLYFRWTPKNFNFFPAILLLLE